MSVYCCIPHTKLDLFFQEEDSDQSIYCCILFAGSELFFQEEDGGLAGEKASLLLGYILDCLGKCFLYDKGTFLTEERFKSLLQPLVDQVEYGSRIELLTCAVYGRKNVTQAL